MIDEKSTSLEWTQRTIQFIGKTNFEKLQKSSVLIVGLGGVGGAVAEMICRAGVGNLTLVDFDIIQHSNINRQLIATHTTVGQQKTEAMKQRLEDINPDVNICLITDKIDENNIEAVLNQKKYDYVVDAIDTLTPKVALLKHCVQNGIKVASSMGSGAKIVPEMVRIDDISKSKYCALAKAVRKRLHKFGIYKGIPVVYSMEISDKDTLVLADEWHKKSIAGTISYMPTLFGVYLSSIVIRGIINKDEEK